MSRRPSTTCSHGLGSAAAGSYRSSCYPNTNTIGLALGSSALTVSNSSPRSLRRTPPISKIGRQLIYVRTNREKSTISQLWRLTRSKHFGGSGPSIRPLNPGASQSLLWSGSWIASVASSPTILGAPAIRSYLWPRMSIYLTGYQIIPKKTRLSSCTGGSFITSCKQPGP